MNKIQDLKRILIKDFSNYLKIDQKYNIKLLNKDKPDRFILKSFLMVAILNIDENIQHAGVVIMKLGKEYTHIFNIVLDFLKAIKNNIAIETKQHFKDKNSFNNQKLIFTNNIYFYTDELVISEMEIIEYFKTKGMNAIIRDNIWRKSIQNNKKPDLFICHDSRDKSYADELYNILVKNLLTILYDKCSLRLGDSLTDKINEGIKDCRF